MQRASSDQSTVSSSTQHDSDAGSGMSSISACGDDFLTEEHMERDFEEADHAQDPAHTPYSAGPFHYSRHQGTHHRPAVRWQSATEMHEATQSRHSPQHLMLSPNKSCMKQTPGGYTLWFSDAQSEQSSANIRPWRSCIKSIEGKQGGQVLQGRKRSRLSSMN